jgi:hypothetical protein
MKFKYLKIDLVSNTTYNCHAAKSHPVDVAWLKKNPGKLFNTDVNIAEREMMLRNERNNSCEQNCWAAEDHGAVSPRMYQDGISITHTQSNTAPEIIDLTINSDCNLTCSYCCKEYSNSWRRDIIDHGDYLTDDVRYRATSKDRLLLKISQLEIKETAQYKTLLEEIRLVSPTLKTLTITGGEPFLDNKLMSILCSLPLGKDAIIEIYTGLGVEYKRFERIVQELQQFDNLCIIVSGENIGKLLEFNRYGTRWDDFIKKIELLKLYNINMRFHSTISNLTVFGFTDFFNYFSDSKIVTTFAYQPQMMSPYVLDKESKEKIKQDINILPDDVATLILESIADTPTETERFKIGQFLKQFVARRKDIDLTVFPQSFLTWAGL